ncbi:hypothetical protein HS088_TW15G01263 [Tripterygium wilfordii]|uniref:Uncharacterized protein n=1 Tax=Tripterygium wilfordii TaxID=458696 RepID=A0A7J7CNU1_TRIWF|nr:hypothetical protein HS088_TW15G01263 [Tripterygium wilfordii]
MLTVRKDGVIGSTMARAYMEKLFDLWTRSHLPVMLWVLYLRIALDCAEWNGWKVRDWWKLCRCPWRNHVVREVWPNSIRSTFYRSRKLTRGPSSFQILRVEHEGQYEVGHEHPAMLLKWA